MKSVLEFEEKYKDILEDIEEWAYIRLKVGYYLKNKSNNVVDSSKISFMEKLKNIFMIKYIFYSFSNWFKRYDYMLFSTMSERRVIAGKYKNKLMDDLIDRLGGKSLLLELNLKRYKNIYTKYIVSELVIYALAKVISFVLKYKSLKNKQQMEYIFEKNNINIDYKADLKFKYTLYIVYKFFLKIYKPKIVFVSCYYCRLPLVKACSKLNIKVVDIQHGVISKEHFGYVSNIKIDKSYIADELLSFGINEFNINNLMIKNVYPIGSYYLSYMENNFIVNKEFINKQKDYNSIVGVSMQDAEWEYNSMIEFLSKLAVLYDDILFIIIPRKRDIEYINQKNIIIVNSPDCYNIIMHCNVHMTLYSSCALEAPTLGVPNILYDVNNMATNYYSNLLSIYHTKIISNIDTFNTALIELKDLKKKDIKKYNCNVFVSNYNKRINLYLYKIKNIQ